MQTNDFERRHAVERRIARKVIEEGLKRGYTFNVNNGGDDNELPERSASVDTVLGAMFATDDDHLIFYRDGKRSGWVWFVYGNDGWDVICDYTMNLEHVIEPEVRKLIDEEEVKSR